MSVDLALDEFLKREILFLLPFLSWQLQQMYAVPALGQLAETLVFHLLTLPRVCRRAGFYWLYWWYLLSPSLKHL